VLSASLADDNGSQQGNDLAQKSKQMIHKFHGIFLRLNAYSLVGFRQPQMPVA
jgi:hypothetical protein